LSTNPRTPGRISEGKTFCESSTFAPAPVSRADRAIKALTGKKVPVALVSLEDADYMFNVGYVSVEWAPTYTVRSRGTCVGRDCETRVSVEEHNGGPEKYLFESCEVIDLYTGQVVWTTSGDPVLGSPHLFPKNENDCAKMFGKDIGQPLTPGMVYSRDGRMKDFLKPKPVQ
jgi:hypothetical protein